ncbi:hypothetical protein M422DRAFT_48193 [Sphaerobolus stellatus SS14]|uniref:Uncharacterized protein n=1 Tax=Sphaerobolus stellatus (strain SS14) TaxID=990650 RepID=A0A0C9VVD5_SPHS4|nr:hypothetical protein M422DRAFT_48193 [Sphaerobolus stellatus SS14]
MSNPFGLPFNGNAGLSYIYSQDTVYTILFNLTNTPHSARFLRSVNVNMFLLINNIQLLTSLTAAEYSQEDLLRLFAIIGDLGTGTQEVHNITQENNNIGHIKNIEGRNDNVSNTGNDTDPDALFQPPNSHIQDSSNPSLSSANIVSLSNILNTSQSVEEQSIYSTEDTQSNDSYPYPYQPGSVDSDMQIDTDNRSQLSQSDDEEISSFSPIAHITASQTSNVKDSNKVEECAQPQISPTRSINEIDAHAWILFKGFTIHLRNLMIEQAAQNTTIDQKYFFYLSSLLYLDVSNNINILSQMLTVCQYLHKQYFVAFEGATQQP